MRRAELIGQRFGRLTVIESQGSKNGKAMWLCQCDCGGSTAASTGDLRKGEVKSCGCYALERRKTANVTHGGSRSKLYNSWRGMKDRCNNPNHSSYKDYGGRGIKVCSEWADFGAFQKWALSNGYQEGLTIDRKDSDGNYCPENCRWATQREQVNNQRSNQRIEFNGETHTLAEWAEIVGINYNTLRGRLLYYGWPIERALTTGSKNVSL